MKTIVITGSTRGIGFGLAHEFLARNHAVVVSGRSQEGVDRAVQELISRHGADRILGQPCDVGVFDQVQALWHAAKAHFGRIDIWVNNAGMGNQMFVFWEQPWEKIQAIIHANLVGLMYGSKIAMQGMLDQGGGQIYNMEGFGSNGSIRKGLLIYGTSKAGVAYFNKGLISETRGTPVRVGILSPGMVPTDLLLGGYAGGEDARRARRIFNILADRVETVTPFLVERMLANNRHGARISWISRPKIFWRFMTAPFINRHVLDDQDLE